MQYLKHTTRDGERWDQIALAYYGRPELYAGIIAANPEVPIVSVLPGGIELIIPVIDLPGLVPDDKLPPWRKAGAQ